MSHRDRFRMAYRVGRKQRLRSIRRGRHYANPFLLGSPEASGWALGYSHEVEE